MQCANGKSFHSVIVGIHRSLRVWLLSVVEVQRSNLIQYRSIQPNPRDNFGHTSLVMTVGVRHCEHPQVIASQPLSIQAQRNNLTHFAHVIASVTKQSQFSLPQSSVMLSLSKHLMITLIFLSF